MNSNMSKTENAFLTVLVLLVVISIKMAFMNNAGWLVLLLALVTGALIIYINKRTDNGNKNKRNYTTGDRL